MKTNTEESYYKYLSCVTLREAWDICKEFFGIWVFLSVLFVVLGGIFNVGIDIAESETGIDPNSLPEWVFGCFLFSLCMWFGQGKEIKFKFPNLTFKSWLFWTVIIFIMAAIFANAPWWVGGPFYFLLFAFAILIDDLAAKGRENYEKLEPESLETTEDY